MDYTGNYGFEGLGMGFWLFTLVIALFMLIANWKMVAKSGQPGIAVIIPIWNVIVQVKMAGFSGWYFLFYLIPGVNVIFAIIVIIRTCKAFGKDGLYAILYILFPYIVIPVLGYGSADWDEARI